MNSGGELFSWWRTVGIGLIGLIVTLVAIFTITFLTNATMTPDSIKTYGVMKHEIVFDKDNITEIEVNSLADAFTQTTFFDQAVTKYLYAKKVDNVYELSLSVVDEMVNDSEALQPFILLRNDIQSMFPNNKVIFKLAVDNLENVVKTIE